MTEEAPWAEEVIVLIRTGSVGRQPVYATDGSAGCDLMVTEDFSLQPGEIRLISLDFVMALPPGVEAQIRPRSGLSLRTALRLPNSPGTIDSDYRDPVGLLLENTYSQADLPLQLLRDPSLAFELSKPGRRLTLTQYIKEKQLDEPGVGVEDTFFQKLQVMSDLANQIIYLDAWDQPFGTLYFKKGERIAQMVFSRYLKARFIPCDQPENVGFDRGGGFGSTGA